ncbi:MAG: polyprenyl diphosphate synthase [Myxococcota bacterium]|nr:polyprenyl diphosphate synthase [Myxococcota bacterium]
MKVSLPDGARVPEHLAIIMDGNGRWAQAQGLERIRGHHEGAESVREITKACREWGVKALTLYSFSTENWKRPEDEVKGLMQLLKRYLKDERRELLDNDIRLSAVGQLDRLPIYVRKPLQALMRETDVPTAKMTLTLCLSYGSRADIVQAARRIAEKAQAGQLRPEDLDEASFGRHLSTAGLPEPDLMIRTSGEVRLSNFLLWELAYAEFYITDVAWPEFRRPELAQAFAHFGRRERRYGMTSAQISAAPSQPGT